MKADSGEKVLGKRAASYIESRVVLQAPPAGFGAQRQPQMHFGRTKSKSPENTSSHHHHLFV